MMTICICMGNQQNLEWSMCWWVTLSIGDVNLIEKQHEKFHLKWVISIREQMVTAMNFIEEHFCRKLFEMTIFMCRNSREKDVHIFHFHLQASTTTRSSEDGGLMVDGGLWIENPNYSIGNRSTLICVVT